MANVCDVAKYILSKHGPMTTMKLQKLVYYCQAWSVVWDSKPIFKEKIESWASGPVVRKLYEKHRGKYKVSTLRSGDINKLKSEEIETIDAVLKFYGHRSAQWLSELTHIEAPWNEARKGIPKGANCSNEITLSSLEEYYGSL
ncbi:Panacea domain-containing protein [Chloroflexota bacterium]